MTTGLAAMIEASYRILVVDDDPQTAELVRSWYVGQPYQILAAKDGQEGIERVAQARPDILLLDLTMPKLDGLQVARRLKADPATRGIPIILLTAHRETTHYARWRETVADMMAEPRVAVKYQNVSPGDEGW